MNYYPPMNHHPASNFHYPPPSLPTPNSSTNRFIYVKHNFINPPPGPKFLVNPPAAPKVLVNPKHNFTNPPPAPKVLVNPKHNFTNPSSAPRVLVNPHFKPKVYVNPQFNPKPKIHVNPNFVNVPKVEPKPVIEVKSTTVISTRNKLVRVPCNSNSIKSEVRKRRNSLHTKYKIVRSSSCKNSSFNKFKIDKRASKVVKPVKKKYVYVNRFLSMDVVAKNVLLKKNSNISKPGFVNINGILYKKSPNSLKKASDTSSNKSLIKKSPNLVRSSSKYKLVRKQRPSSSQLQKSLVKRYKLIRSRKSQEFKKSPNKLRKCNIPCTVFRKTGKCSGKLTGTCFKVHNPDQIVLCTRFLQGACLNENCLLSHKVSLEKMPTCKYYLEGLCSRDNCPYLHVKISPKADICRNFLEGFCKKGAECDKRHQFLCPDFEKNKKCAKKRCPYPHKNTVRKSTKVLNSVAKKCSAKKVEKKEVEKEQDEKNRYYQDGTKGESGEVPVIKTVARERPKLGQLPAFIPFFEGT